MRVGIDAVEIQRVGRIVARTPRFVPSVYAPEEARRAAALSEGRREEFLAGRLAAKEAVLKALGTGITTRSLLREIVVAGPEHGPHILLLRGSTAALAASLGLSRFLLSISHDGRVALAVAIFQ